MVCSATAAAAVCITSMLLGERIEAKIPRLLKCSNVWVSPEVKMRLLLSSITRLTLSATLYSMGGGSRYMWTCVANI